MKSIQLAGRLGRIFGREFLQDVHTPAEAIRALCTLIPGFEKELERGNYVVFRLYDDGVLDSDTEMLHLQFGAKCRGIKIVPATKAAKFDLFKIIAGVVLIGAAFLLTGGALGATAFSVFGMSVTGGQLALVGGLLALSGVSGLLAPQMNTDNMKQSVSYVIEAPTNNSAQGQPVPLVYGFDVFVGSIPIADGIFVEEYEPTGEDDKDVDNEALSSLSTIKIIDLLSEGRTGDLKQIYLNGTPLTNKDGTRNFKGVKTRFRDGSAWPDQKSFASFPQAMVEMGIGIEIKHELPVTFTIDDEDVTAVMLKVRIPQLTKYIHHTGDIEDQTLEFKIEVKQATGGFVETPNQMVITGHNSAPYERVKRIDLDTDKGGAPWIIRVTRLTDDSDDATVQNASVLSSYTMVYDARMSYADSAIAMTEFDARLFGSSVPARIFQMDGMYTDVPSNYDPVARTYTGIWDGTFKQAIHENPAWVLWDLATQKRYGLGEKIAKSGVDKYALYAIGQYADAKIDGKPRYSFRGVINKPFDASQLLDTIITCMRGMIYWATGSISFTADMPGTVKKNITPANVINGDIRYTTSAKKARHSTVIVQYSNPDNLGKPAYEVVQRASLVKRFGYQPLSYTAIGCYDREVAIRIGDWILDTEEHENKVATWEASLDNAALRPGHLVDVADPIIQAGRFGGRIVDVSGTTLTLDAPIPSAGGITSINCTLPNGNLENRLITGFFSGRTVITVNTAFSQTPQKDSVYIAIGDIVPQTFRVLTNNEKDDMTWTITALQHDPTKYARIERHRDIKAPDYTLYRHGPLLPPVELKIDQYFKTAGRKTQAYFKATWNHRSDARVTGYQYQVMGFGAKKWSRMRAVTQQEFDYGPLVDGMAKIRVRSTGPAYEPSAWLTIHRRIRAYVGPIPDVSKFAIALQGGHAKLTWVIDDNDSIDKFEIRHSSKTDGSATWYGARVLTRKIDGDERQYSTIAKTGTYFIKAISFKGRYSKNAKNVINTISDLVAQNVVSTLDESPDWNGLLYQRHIVGVMQTDFTLSYFWTPIGVTVATYSGDKVQLNETATTGVHALAVRPFEVPGRNDCTFEATLVDHGRLVQIDFGDGHGNVHIIFDPSTSTYVAASSSGRLTLTSHTNSGNDINIQFSTDDATQTIAPFFQANNGISNSYAGNVTKGFIMQSPAFRTVNQSMESGTDSFLRLKSLGSGNYVQIGYYTFANAAIHDINDASIDLSRRSKAKMYVDFDFDIPAAMAPMTDWTTLSAIERMSNSQHGVDVSMQVRTANDTDADTGLAFYGDWDEITDATYRFRYAQFRIVVTSDHKKLTPVISSAAVTVDMPDRTLSDKDVACTTAGYNVVYTPAFMEKPAISVNGQGMNTGDYYRITSKTRFGCLVMFYDNTDTPVARTFDWIAKGYGEDYG